MCGILERTRTLPEEDIHRSNMPKGTIEKKMPLAFALVDNFGCKRYQKRGRPGSLLVLDVVVPYSFGFTPIIRKKLT